MWKEVVADEHREHDKVIDDALQVVVEWQCGPYVPELEIEILAQERQMQKVEIDRLQPFRSRSTSQTTTKKIEIADAPGIIPLFRRRPKLNLFTKQTKMRVMAQQAKHNEVRIKAI